MAKKTSTHVSDFARNQLEKCGWTEGTGLGQGGRGITEAIKVNLKRDNHGVGHDSGKEFTHHWWNHVYDKAASKIKVNQTEEGDVDITKVEDGSENRTKRSEKASSALYQNFVKSTTVLEDGIEVKNTKNDSSSSEDEVEIEKKTRLDDDDLFRICGGRTAHKGARHGLKLSGKLARIAAQEAQHSSPESPLVLSKKHEVETANCENGENVQIPKDVSIPENNRKKKKKRESKSENGLASSEGVSCSNGASRKKKRKRDRSTDCDTVDELSMETCETNPEKRDVNNCEKEEKYNDGKPNNHISLRKKKKKKRKNDKSD